MSLSTIPCSNETKNTAHRTTKDGRRIRYEMQVIQQPERARACGSGAKSSADRRPVDPPPIVELRIYENDQDVTFAYNANFFLHASLENARPIAPGRTAPSISGTPVLTGTPVAGMVHAITLLLIIVGAVNWGLVGLFQFDLVAALFGGQDAVLARLVYILVGASGLYQLVPLGQAISGGHSNPQLAGHRQ